LMFLVTFFQVLPPSRVRFTWPSLLPVQITPSLRGDSAMAYRVQPSNVKRLSLLMPPEFCWWLLSLVVRSGLITVQLWPPLVVWCTYWLPISTLLWLCLEMTMGKFQCQRYFILAGAHP